jgi:uncharacterized protein YdhG (YjbR/CyaY superfamily)
MASKPNSTTEYIDQIPVERKEAFRKLRTTVLENLKGEFQEGLSYGMIGFTVPHSAFPDGYHCNPKLPLPFVSIANQKNFIALYHMGLYADRNLQEWFTSEYTKHTHHKIDMGKSCIRFKKMDDIPYTLIAELLTRMDISSWIELYKSSVRK